MIAQPKHTFSSANLLSFASLVLINPTGASASNLLQSSRANLPTEEVRSTVSAEQAQTNVAQPAQFIHELSIRPLKDKIEAYRALAHGWDGPNSKPPAPAAVEAATRFLESLSPGVSLPEVTLAGDGEISISWRDEYKFVDISFYGDHATAYSRLGKVIHKQQKVNLFYELPVTAVEALLSS
jgi:hypothetical protein